MGGVIKGYGKGYEAWVCENGRLWVRSTGVDIASSKSQMGRAFLLNTGILPVTTTKGHMAWIGYNATDKYLSIERMNVFWNGGDTNHNRCVEVSFNVADTEPTGGNEDQPIRNANTAKASENEIVATAHRWDGTTGTGMTGSTPAVEVSQTICAQGKSPFQLDGIQIIGPGGKMSVYARGEEAGNFSFTCWLFELDPEELR